MVSYKAAFRNAVRATNLSSAQRRFPITFRSLPNAQSPRLSAGAYRRPYSTEAVDPVEPPEYLSEGERRVFDMIKVGLQPTKLEVQDISGGCGSMYALDIVSDHFKDLPVIKQHRLVNKVLGEEMKSWHGVQMKTKASS